MANYYTEEQKQLSKESIQQALFELMRTMEYASITISQLTNKAGVSRMGFYRNYESKDQVLTDFFDSYMDDFYQQLTESTPKDPTIIGLNYFNYVKGHSELFTVLIQSKAEHILNERFTYYVSKFYSDNVQSIPFEGAYAKYWNDFVSTGLYKLTIEWIKNDCQESSEFLTSLVIKLAG